MPNPRHITALLLLALAPPTPAMESDQFLTWGIELADAAEPLNAYFNETIATLLDIQNQYQEDCDCEELTQDIFYYFFEDRSDSPIRTWIRESGQVDLYPPIEVSDSEYRSQSVYRNAKWPIYIPVSRTIRIGDVYLGLDKIGHMFGFGGRYYKRYLRHRDQGFTEHEAMEKIIRWGIYMENTIVGKWADGIFSHADLEANFQGFSMARAFCEGRNPHLQNIEGRWTLARPVDLRRYATPGLDESYNTPHYWPTRLKSVRSVITQEYCGKLHLVQDRFDAYRNVPPSFSQQYIEAHFDERGKDPQQDHGLDTLCGGALPAD